MPKKIPKLIDLEQVLKKHPMIDKFILSDQVVIDCSVSKLFEIAFQDDAVLPWDQFWKQKIPTKNQQVSKWIYGQGNLPPKAKIEKSYKLDKN